MLVAVKAEAEDEADAGAEVGGIAGAEVGAIAGAEVGAEAAAGTESACFDNGRRGGALGGVGGEGESSRLGPVLIKPKTSGEGAWQGHSCTP